MDEQYQRNMRIMVAAIVILNIIALNIATVFIILSNQKQIAYSDGLQDGQLYVINQVQNLQIPIANFNQELNRTDIRYITAGQYCGQIFGQG